MCSKCLEEKYLHMRLNVFIIMSGGARFSLALCPNFAARAIKL